MKRKLGGGPRGMTRWEEVQDRIHTMVEILKFVPTQAITLSFMNRGSSATLQRQGLTPQQFEQNAHQQIERLFSSPPSGLTPTKRVLTQAFQRFAGKSTMHYFFTDGCPSDSKGSPAPYQGKQITRTFWLCFLLLAGARGLRPPVFRIHCLLLGVFWRFCGGRAPLYGRRRGARGKTRRKYDVLYAVLLRASCGHRGAQPPLLSAAGVGKTCGRPAGPVLTQVLGKTGAGAHPSGTGCSSSSSSPCRARASGASACWPPPGPRSPCASGRGRPRWPPQAFFAAAAWGLPDEGQIM
eukprot:TRINITY_DN3537_c0_g1_i2.p1 TRINITY_DN3537_c0_g1~~TRINITY_DN3537_c0_g1_i2.p1  ORF type:complete len:295 (+),score=14.08 TRINITY_DN3537_c0_g1_i2:132-1016(+)